MNDFQIDQIQKCFKHNQPAIFFSKQINNPLCKLCLESQQFSLIEDYLEQQKEMFFKIQIKSDLSLNLINELLQSLDAYKKNFIKTIDNLSQILNQQYKIIQEKQSKFKSLFKKYEASTVEMINNEEKIDNLFQILNNYSLKINLDNEENKILGGNSTQSRMKIDKKFDFQLIQQSSYQQNEISRAIVFNKDASLMIAACGRLIKVFEFQDDKIREVQQLNGHSKDVFCLQFMKKSSQFISGSKDSTIIIWVHNQNNLWQTDQVLKVHTSNINCIMMNQNEGILISGSSDKTIKFWQKQNNAWNAFQSLDCQSCIHNISLSQFEDKLIASWDDKSILMLQLQGKEWMIKQKISVQQNGYRLCFINQDQFVFQPKNGQHLLIFDYDSKDQTFKQGQKIQYANKVFDDWAKFPIRYIPQIELIMVKHYDNVHFIKRSQDGQFNIEQSINFGTNELFGGITEDGRFIATWDGKSKEIQIRKYDY